MKSFKSIGFFMIVLLSSGLLMPTAGLRFVNAQEWIPPLHYSGAIPLPENYQPEPSLETLPTLTSQTNTLKAVAIVGDVGGFLSTFKEDMDDAVDALEAHGVTVIKFYYGNSSFGWNDIVNAATNANFLLYMGHGIYSGSCSTPISVGGFSLGGGRFVSSNQIRTDLSGRLSPDSVVILSHACFSAGGSSCDPSGWPSQEEAERRVKLYAEPFVDIGVKSYFSNNYYGAAAAIVNQLLADPATRKTSGNIFKSVYPYNTSKFRDLSYPKDGYDLWLSGSTPDWDHAFVGLPDYLFAGDIVPAVPQLGGIPRTINFTYYMGNGMLLGANRAISPQNTGSDTPLNWQITSSSHFTISPLQGTTPDSFTITPKSFMTTSIMTYTDIVTLTVTDPMDVEGSPQAIQLNLRILDGYPHHLYLPAVARNYQPPIPTLTPNDPYYSTRQWGLTKINAPLAWGSAQGNGVLVAVIDTGADFSHPDLAEKLRSDIDYDYVNSDSNAQDDEGHGSHVAGIAAAATNNATGVAGLGWNSTVLPLKALDASGEGYVSDITAAIWYAVEQGARVINLSLGSHPSLMLRCDEDFPSLAEAIDHAYHEGVLTVVAAGNEYADAGNVVPANCSHVIVVAATDQQDQGTDFSNDGSTIDVAAPGVNIYSTYPSGSYAYESGTSMATPFVAGLAALVWSRYPTYTPDQVASAIMDNAVAIEGSYGCGRIDAGAAVITGAVGSTPLCKSQALGAALSTSDRQGQNRPLQAETYASGRVIIKLHPTVSSAALQDQGYTLETESNLGPGLWRVQVPDGQEWETVQTLMQEGTVEYAHVDYKLSAQ